MRPLDRKYEEGPGAEVVRVIDGRTGRVLKSWGLKSAGIARQDWAGARPLREVPLEVRTDHERDEVVEAVRSLLGDPDE